MELALLPEPPDDPPLLPEPPQATIKPAIMSTARIIATNLFIVFLLLKNICHFAHRPPPVVRLQSHFTTSSNIWL
jgi:hypothetical protein